MPYRTIAELPPGTNLLPDGAKIIYKDAFNGAWETYADAEDREQRAHATAWAAVKQKYEKKNTRWRLLPDKQPTAEVAEAGTGGAPMPTPKMKNENGVDYPAEDFAYVPNAEAPGSWKCRMAEKPGKATRAQLGAACGALGTIPEKDLPSVRRKLRAQYAKLGVDKADMPESVMEAEEVGGPGGVPAGMQVMVLAEEPIEGEALVEQPEEASEGQAQELDGSPIAEAYEEGCLTVEALAEGEEAPVAEALAEGAPVPTPERPIIATLIKAGLNSKSTRNYTPVFLKQCVAEGRFSEAYCHVDHPTPTQAREQPARTLATIAAHTGTAFWDEGSQSVKAPLVWLNADKQGTAGYIAEGLFRSPVVRKRSGLSIFYQGPVRAEEVMIETAGGRKKVQVPKGLGDGRKFDVDLVTAPGAGGGLPLYESDLEGKESKQHMTLAELKELHPELVDALKEEFAAETPTAEPTPIETPAEPVAEQVTPDPAPAPEPVSEVEAPKAVDPAIAELRAKVARLESERMLDEALSHESVHQSIKDTARAALIDDTFADEAGFKAKYEPLMKGLKEVASQAAGPRVTDLGGTPPADPSEGKLTLGDLTKKKEAK